MLLNLKKLFVEMPITVKKGGLYFIDNLAVYQ